MVECNENIEPPSFPRSLTATTSRFQSSRSKFRRFDITTVSCLIWFKVRCIRSPIITFTTNLVGVRFSSEYLVNESGDESNEPSTTQRRRGRRTGVDGCLFTIRLQLKGALSGFIMWHTLKEHTMKTSPLLSTTISMDLPSTTSPSSLRRGDPPKFTLT
jgi:hypothetical protein